MSDEPRRILVMLPTWVGDAVMATPALAALRRRFPEASIAWTGSPAARAVLAGLDLAEAVVPDVSRAGLWGFWAAVRQWRREKIDLAVLLSNAFRVALLARLGGARRRVGYDRDGRGWLLSDKLAPARQADGTFAPTPAIDYYLALVERLGGQTGDRRMRLAVEPQYEAKANELFAAAGVDAARPIMVLNPGASFGASKLWPAERFAAVGDGLIERYDAQIVINAAPAERAIAETVEAAMTHAPAVSFARRDNSLGLLKAIIARSALLVTGDTGPRHIAAALGAAVVTIFGPTDPRWAELNYDKERIVRADVPCAPCQQKVCPLPKSPEYHQCMRRIAPEAVLAAAADVLSRYAGLE